MTPPELIAEREKMEAVIVRLNGTQDDMEQAQLASARALKFAIECQMHGRKLSPAPGALPDNVISLAEYKLKRAQKHGH